jgi:hypothetical protein
MQMTETLHTAPNKELNQKDRLKIILYTNKIDDRTVYVSGNFNNWKTQDERLTMEQIGTNKYQYEFPVHFNFTDNLLYKFTKGDWSEVELGINAQITPNRFTYYRTGTIIEYVLTWRKNWLPFKPNFLPKLHLISEEFEIPQLNKTRKIWALLPHDYQESSETYPVLYLQDAQNLFNEKAKYGN